MSRAAGLLRERRTRAVHTLDLPAAGEQPALPAIVEPGRRRRALALALAQADPPAPALVRCDVTKVHYRPGKDCRLVISAQFSGGRGADTEQLYFGRLIADADRRPSGGAPRVHTPVRHAPAALPRFGPPSVHLAEWGLWLCAYPNDPELPGLPLLADPARVRARFA